MCDTKVMRVVTDWTPIAPGSDRAPRTRKGCEVLFFLFFFFLVPGLLNFTISRLTY